MEHNYIELNEKTSIQVKNIYQRDNNLDGLDNLDEIPEVPAVFAVCGKVNGKAANPRYVGVAQNLREKIQNFFDKDEKAPEDNQCFKEFMLSIKLKVLIFETGDGTSLKQKKLDWEKTYQPKCNDALNEIH